jgi:hypothetical protein
MSHLAHEKKRLGTEAFINKYKNINYRGIYKKYLDSYIEYLTNQNTQTQISIAKYPNILVVDPYVYRMYFKAHSKEEFNDALNKAISEFLKRGILLVEVQEAV